MVQITPPMVSRSQVKFVRESICRKGFVQKLGAFLKPVTVLITAIEIKLQTAKLVRVFGKGKRAVRFPIGFA